MSNTFHIIFCFSWKSEHEVKLYLIPSTFECFTCTMKDHFFGKSFVNYITKSLGTGFRCESKAALLYILYLAHNIQGKSIDTQGWQRYIDSIAMKFFDQEVYQFLQLRIITGA